jgi:hypothetical protein
VILVEGSVDDRGADLEHQMAPLGDQRICWLALIRRCIAPHCTKATSNQLRLFLHAGAYWLMWGLRVSMPKRSMWRVAQFDALRLRLIKIAARVVEMKTMIRVHLPTSCPVQDMLRFALGRIPRHVT